MAVEYPLIFGFIKIVGKIHFPYLFPLKFEPSTSKPLFHALRAF